MSILEETTNVECKVFSIVCVSRGNPIWGACIEMGTEPRMWLYAGRRNGSRINKRCINVGLNWATLGLFIWPHLQESIRCRHASFWGDRVWSSITLLCAALHQLLVLFTMYGHFHFTLGWISSSKQHCHWCEYLFFPFWKMLELVHRALRNILSCSTMSWGKHILKISILKNKVS